MTGEMYKPKNAEKGESYWKGRTTGIGYSAIGDDGVLIRPNYPNFFRLADRLKRAGYRATVEPFDVYQGPYVSVAGCKIWGGKFPNEWTIEYPGPGRDFDEKYQQFIDNRSIVNVIKQFRKPTGKKRK